MKGQWVDPVQHTHHPCPCGSELVRLEEGELDEGEPPLYLTKHKPPEELMWVP